jgi:hypothetical protein
VCTSFQDCTIHAGILIFGVGKKRWDVSRALSIGVRQEKDVTMSKTVGQALTGDREPMYHHSQGNKTFPKKLTHPKRTVQ